MSFRSAAAAAAAVAALLLNACARQQQADVPPAAPAVEAATNSEAGGAAQTIVAAVSIPPQGFLLQRVGGDRVEVLVVVQQGQAPETYEPTAQQLVALAGAKTYFAIGLPFETALLDKIAGTMPDLHVVDTREGIQLRPLEEGIHDAHVDEEPTTYGEPVMDPHVWLSPRNAKTMARTMERELVRLDPGGSEQYERNLMALDAELDRLDATIATILKPLAGSDVLVYHPAFGYLTDAYGLHQVAIETEGKEPGPKELAQIVTRAKETGIKVLFVQPEFSDSSARAIAEEIGGAVVPINPLAGDYIENLAEMASTIKAGLVGTSDRRPDQDG